MRTALNACLDSIKQGTFALRSMGEIRIERRGQLIVSTWPEHPSVSGTTAFFDSMERLLAEKKPLALVIDASSTKSAPREVRELAGQRMNAKSQLMREHLKGQATVLSSALIRGALATVYLLSPPGYPTRTFSDLPSACKWAEGQLLK